MAIQPPRNNQPMRSAGGGASTDTPATTNNTQTNVVSSATPGATNPTSFLYDVGLQNVYQDYQKNIASLNQNQQQSLQEAYYIREMSKKYLGEYASNTGIGDVSGNLLDIYGQYQQTTGAIRSDFGTKELSLQGQYDAARRELEGGKMAAELEEGNRAQLDGTVAFSDISSPTTIDANGNPVTNPNFVEGFDFKYYNLPEGFNTSTQSVYKDMAGTEYYNVAVDVNTEAADENSRFYEGATSEDLLEEFSRINGEDSRPTQGDIIPLNGVNYVLRDGKFYRLQTFGSDQGPAAFSRIAQSQESNWFGDNIKSGNRQSNEVGIFKQSGIFGDDEDLIYVNLNSNLKYTNANESGNKDAIDFNISTNLDSKKGIIAEFSRVHGVRYGKIDGGRNMGVTGKVPSVVEFQGKLYYMNTKGDVWQLRPRNQMTN
jgi:hypothetical protein